MQTYRVAHLIEKHFTSQGILTEQPLGWEIPPHDLFVCAETGKAIKVGDILDNCDSYDRELRLIGAILENENDDVDPWILRTLGVEIEGTHLVPVCHETGQWYPASEPFGNFTIVGRGIIVPDTSFLSIIV